MNKRFSASNQERPKLLNRGVAIFQALSDMPEKAVFNVINHRQANNNRFNLRTFHSLALKFHGWAYFMMPNKMERVRNSQITDIAGFTFSDHWLWCLKYSVFFRKPVILGISDIPGNVDTCLLTNFGLFWFNARNRLSITQSVWEEIDAQILGFKKNEVIVKS